MHPKEDSCIPMVSQAEIKALAERIEEALQVPPESLAKVEAIHFTLTRLDVTVVPKR